MKSYGKIDESWDEVKFRALIEDALRTARERGIPVAIQAQGRFCSSRHRPVN